MIVVLKTRTVKRRGQNVSSRGATWTDIRLRLHAFARRNGLVAGPSHTDGPAPVADAPGSQLTTHNSPLTYMPSVRKAAVLLMSLPEDEAAQVLGKLTPKQVEAVTIEIAKLGEISGDEAESVINEFADSNPTSLAGGKGGLDAAKSLVERALGKNASNTLDNVRQQIEALPFGFLQKVDSQNLLTFIIDEHPQTIALILSHLPPAQAAEIVAGLPSDRQLSVIRRVATMGQTNPEIIQEVEKGLENRMASLMNQQFEAAGGVPTVAEILNVADRTTERTLLENLAQEDPDLVEEIRRLMFVFEDLTKFSDKDIQIGAQERRDLAVGDGLEGGQRGAEAESARQYVAASRRHAQGRNGLSRPGQALGRRANAAADCRYRPPPRRRRRNHDGRRRSRGAVHPIGARRRWPDARAPAAHFSSYAGTFVASARRPKPIRPMTPNKLNAIVEGSGTTRS